MSATTAVTVRDRLGELIQYIKTGHIIEAMQEFYDKEVEMQENTNPPTVGLAANIEREKQFLSSVKEWKGSEVKAIALDRDTSFVEWVFDWIATDGTQFTWNRSPLRSGATERSPTSAFTRTRVCCPNLKEEPPE